MKTCYLIAMLALAFAMNLSPAWAMEVKQDKPFVIPRERIATSVRRIGVMPVSIPANVPHRLAVAQRLEAAIESQLRAGGFEIVPAALMRDIREDLADAIGGMYDAVTGNPVEAKLASLDEYARTQYEASNEVEAWLRPSVVVRKVVATGGVASWDGAVEPVAKEGDGALPGLSLLIRLEDNNGTALYARYGALQMTGLFYSNGTRVRQVAVDRVHLMEDPERDRRALMIALQPLASGAETPPPAKLPPVAAVPMAANPEALRLPRSELLSGYRRVALLPLSWDEGSLRPEVIARYRELLEARLTAAGFEIVDAAQAGAALEALRRSTPGFHDLLTGDFDEARWNAARLAILKEQGPRLGVQAFVDPVVVTGPAFVRGNEATWDGAKESIAGAKPASGKMLGPDAGSSGTVPALSLRLTISDLEDRRLFDDEAGIQLAARQVGGQLYEVPQSGLFSNPDADLRAAEMVLREIIATPESGKRR